MLLSSIEIQGFKSFADKTKLKFGKGITAVVGPNGSGKSNISDAVRWVLGEQSTKSLRGQSMEDVIFSGTAQRRPHGFCEVTLNIDNSDRSLNFDNDSVAVTRRYYRSHESEYLINNISVRLKDVHELFMDTGLGRDGYSMIGQGKIDSIISSKSQERRDIFEEASGISKYRYRKLEAERKLAAAEDNLVRLKDIMAELESRVGPLEQQSKKAQKFLELSDQKRELEIGLWMYMLDNSKEALTTQEGKIAVCQQQYDSIDRQLTDIANEIEQTAAIFANYNAKIETLRAQTSDFDEAIATKNGEIALLNNNIAHNTESIERVNGEIEDIKSSDLNAKEQILSKRNEAEQKQSEVDALNKTAAELQTKLAELVGKSENISRNIEDKVKILNSITAETADHRVNMVTAKSSIEEISNRFEQINSTLEKRQESKAELEKELKELSEFLERIEQTVTECKNSLGGYELLLKTKKEALESDKQKTDSIRIDIETKKRRAQILQDLENNMDGFANSVKQVIKEAEKGTLQGILGPVSRLISVDKEYAIAIETALANALQNIIVETEADAKKAINYLKSTNSGRATFLPVSSIKAKDIKESDIEDCFGYVGVASDLVKCDKKYEQIVKHLLAGTVVTEDIDSAVAIAKKTGYKVKLVSLDGQVVNVGGSLTGGSHVKNAGMLSRVKEIERLNSDIQSLNEKLERYTAIYNESSAAVSKLEANIIATESELTCANEDKIRTLAEIKRVEELENSVLNDIKDLSNERELLDVKTKQLSVQVEESLKLVNELELKKTAIQLEIDGMTGGRDDLSDEREKIAALITENKLKVIETEKDIQQLLDSALSIEQAIDNRASRLEQMHAQIEQYNELNASLLQQIENVNGEIERLKSSGAENENAVLKLLELRKESEQKSNDLRNAEREAMSNKEIAGGELARLSERKQTMIKEYDDIIRQLYDEYQLTRSDAENMGIKISKPADAKKELAEIKSKIRNLGTVNVAAIEEYKEVSERYTFMKAQIDDIETSRTELYRLINTLTSQMKEIFSVGFDRIAECFSKTFSELFGGGTAKLVLSDPENVLESGIDIVAKLPGKNVPSLDGLSGGEKALTALSIYFAIMQVNAPPFCFLDEVDTALDDINVDRFAEYMKKSNFDTQFICVTHRRGTMEAADMLYGVTMQEKGVSKLLELNVTELEKKLNITQ